MTVRKDVDPQETREWLDALDGVLRHDGHDRAEQLIGELLESARRRGVPLEVGLNTPYVNTIAPEDEDRLPGDLDLEHRIQAIIRWNAIALVLQANQDSSELGGHVASYQSAATLYEVGFNHFWRAPSDTRPGDLVYMQGHSSPGIYARSFLEGRLSEDRPARLPPGDLQERPLAATRTRG